MAMGLATYLPHPTGYQEQSAKALTRRGLEKTAKPKGISRLGTSEVLRQLPPAGLGSISIGFYMWFRATLNSHSESPQEATVLENLL